MLGGLFFFLHKTGCLVKYTIARNNSKQIFAFGKYSH